MSWSSTWPFIAIGISLALGVIAGGLTWLFSRENSVGREEYMHARTQMTRIEQRVNEINVVVKAMAPNTVREEPVVQGLSPKPYHRTTPWFPLPHGPMTDPETNLPTYDQVALATLEMMDRWSTEQRGGIA